jgi:hypothetical protein
VYNRPGRSGVAGKVEPDSSDFPHYTANIGYDWGADCDNCYAELHTDMTITVRTAGRSAVTGAGLSKSLYNRSWRGGPRLAFTP